MSVVIIGGGSGGGASDWGSITGKPTIQTTVGDPGSDSNLVSEQAVREAITAGGIGVSDGDKGDITVSSTGTVWNIDANAVGTTEIADAAVTLAKMANLAQDQFIVRTTASTGVPQTATVTSFARTLLDDADAATARTTLGVGSGTGDVTKVGTPVDNQLGVWTGSGTLEGDTALTFDTSTDTLTIAASGNLAFGAVTVFDDNAGTTTLQNIDAIDSTTESTIEVSIDTLPNLISVQGRTVTLADAGANAFFGWDDAAGAYENLTAAEAEAIIEPLIDTLANLTSVQGLTLTLADAGTDRLLGWDDSANAYQNLSAADALAALGITTDGAAVAADVNTGTSTTLAITPDAFAGSNLGTKSVVIEVFAPTADVTPTGNDKAVFIVPAPLNGMNLISCAAKLKTAGITGAVTVMVRNETQTADMLTAVLSIASTAITSTGGTVDTANDDVATGDTICIDLDSIATGTAAKGLYVVLNFQLP